MCVRVCVRSTLFVYAILYLLSAARSYNSDRETNMWKGIVYGRQLGPTVQMSPGNNTAGSAIYSAERKHIKLRTNRPTWNRIGNRTSRGGLYTTTKRARTRNSDKSALYIISDYRRKLFFIHIYIYTTVILPSAFASDKLEHLRFSPVIASFFHNVIYDPTTAVIRSFRRRQDTLLTLKTPSLLSDRVEFHAKHSNLRLKTRQRTIRRSTFS